MRALAHADPSLNIATIAKQINGLSGSIYHRFRSREEILIQLWLRSISRFHIGFLAAVNTADPNAAIRAFARHVVSFCRQYPQDALAMTLYRHSKLVHTVPTDLKNEVEHINDGINAAIGNLCQRRYGILSNQHREILTLAIVQTPYGIVRPYVGTDVPQWLDDAAITVAVAITALGDNLVP